MTNGHARVELAAAAKVRDGQFFAIPLQAGMGNGFVGDVVVEIPVGPAIGRCEPFIAPRVGARRQDDAPKGAGCMLAGNGNQRYTVIAGSIPRSQRLNFVAGRNAELRFKKAP